MRQSALNTGQREGCRLAARSALRIISTCHVVHPLPLRGIPLKGTQDVTGLASCPHSHSERSEESWYAAHMRQSAVNRSVGSSRLRRLPPIPLRGTSPLESVSRDFHVAIAPLQITFACHPRPGGRINCPTLTCIFIWHYGLAAAGGIHTHRPAGRYLHPLNLLNPLHLLNPFL